MTDSRYENTRENRIAHPCPSRWTTPEYPHPNEILPCCLPEGHVGNHQWKAGAYAAGTDYAVPDWVGKPSIYWTDEMATKAEA